MNIKILKHNKLLISVVILLFFVVVFVVYITAYQMYDLQSSLNERSEKAHLQTGKEVVELYFSEAGKKLLFIKNLGDMKAHINEDFISGRNKDKVQNAFYELLVEFPDIYQARIVDLSGQETIKVVNRSTGKPEINLAEELENRKNVYYFKKSLDNNEDDIYLSAIDMNIEHRRPDLTEIIRGGDIDKLTYIPTINLSTPIFNSEGIKKGVLMLDIYLSKVFSMIPDNVFIMAEDGNLVSMRPDGTFEIKKPEFKLLGARGTFDLPEGGSIHYLTADILSIKSLLLGKNSDIGVLKASLIDLAITPSYLIIFFISLIGLISYLNISRTQEVIGSQKTLINSLAYLAEWRDKETGAHLERTRKYAVILARQLRKNLKFRLLITKDFIDDIFDAAPLHDIGKVGIKDYILLKEGELNDDEFKEMKKHVNIGKSVLDRDIEESKTKQSFIIMGRNICAYHHEKYNGKGYFGFKGDEIPLEARIFALCDAYDAIRADRPYEDEVSHVTAVERIMLERGEHFDPGVVDAFFDCQRSFLEISSRVIA